MMSDDKINVDDDSSRVTLFYHLSVYIYVSTTFYRSEPTDAVVCQQGYVSH